MTVLCILRDHHTARPWWRADQRWGISPEQRIWCDCCNAYSPADETEVRLWCDESPVGDWGDYQDPELAAIDGMPGWQPSWFDPRWQTRCADGFGCTVKPRRRASAHLRSGWHSF